MERQLERRDLKLRGPLITRVFTENLAASALVETRSFEAADVQMVRKAIALAAPFAHPRVLPNYWEHVVYSSILARHLAAKVACDELDPYEAECLQLIDDYGSMVVPHRYFRKNVVNELIGKSVGIRTDLAGKQPSIPQILGRREPVLAVSDLTLPQVILDLADNLGKLNPDGTPFSIQQVQELYAFQPKRYAGDIFATERFGLRALTQAGKQELAIDLIFAEIGLLQTQHAINIEEVFTAAFTEFSLPENQDYLRTLKQAQETLDPDIDKVLGRPPIQIVVFDIGGVLTNFADNELWQAMSARLGRSPEEISRVIGASLDEGLSGKISKEEYLRRFFAAFDLPFPMSPDEAERYFVHPEIYHPTPGMPELMGRILRNPNLQVFVLSDAISPLVKPNLDILRSYYPGIQTGNVLFSSIIGASKREPGSPAFKAPLDRLGNPDPQTILFIDDSPNYTTAARAEYKLRSMHFRENDPERLTQELETAKLIRV